MSNKDDELTLGNAVRGVENFGNGFISDLYDFTGGSLGMVASGMEYVKSGDRKQWRGMSDAFYKAAKEREDMIDEGSIPGTIGGLAGYAMGGAKAASALAGKFGAKNTSKLLEILYPNKHGVNNMRRQYRRARKKHFDKHIVQPVGVGVGVSGEAIRDKIVE